VNEMMSLDDLRNLKKLLTKSGIYKHNEALAKVVTEKMVRKFLHGNVLPRINNEFIKPLHELFLFNEETNITGIVE